MRAPATRPASPSGDIDHTTYLTAASSKTKPDGIRALFHLEQPDRVSFLAGRPNPASFPFKSLTLRLDPPLGSGKDGKEYTIDIEGDDMVEALSYGPTSGAPRFHKWCTDFSAQIHARPIDPSWRTTVGAGCQDLIAKAFNCLISPGDHVLCESPAYSGALAILTLVECQTHEIPIDSQGVSPKALRALLESWPEGVQKPKVLYTVPVGSNPSGTSAGLERKLEILHLAREHGFLIMEDDPYYFLSTVREPSYFELETQVIPNGGLVVRFDSFSKVLASGLRLGFATGPKAIIDAMDVHTATVNLQPSSMSQAMAWALLSKWGVDGFLSHAAEVAKFYDSRRIWFEELAHKHLDGLATWDSPSTSMFLWINIAPLLSYHFTLTRAVAHGVLGVPGKAFMPSAHHLAPGQEDSSTYIRLSFSVIERDAADEGLRRLACAIREGLAEQEKKHAGKKGTVSPPVAMDEEDRALEVSTGEV